MTEQDPIAAAANLEQSMGDLAADIRRLSNRQESAETYGHRNRQLIWGLVACFVFSIAMGVVAVTASLQAKEATSQSKRNAENAKISCEVGNEGRELQNQLWTYVLDLSSENPNLTAHEKKQIAMFRGYIARVYAPRDCDNSPTIPPGTVTPTR